MFGFGNKNIVLMTHEDVYKWENGVCLKALQDVELMFPGILFNENTTIGEVIEVSNRKTKIGLYPGQHGERFESINIRLKKGDSLKINKDIETVITFHSKSPSKFKIMES